MKVLMFGWEYPPNVIGGIATDNGRADEAAELKDIDDVAGESLGNTILNENG